MNIASASSRIAGAIALGLGRIAGAARVPGAVEFCTTALSLAWCRWSGRGGLWERLTLVACRALRASLPASTSRRDCPEACCLAPWRCLSPNSSGRFRGHSSRCWRLRGRHRRLASLSHSCRRVAGSPASPACWRHPFRHRRRPACCSLSHSYWPAAYRSACHPAFRSACRPACRSAFHSACRYRSHCSCSAFARADYSWAPLRPDRSATDRRGQRECRVTRQDTELPPKYADPHGRSLGATTASAIPAAVHHQLCRNVARDGRAVACWRGARRCAAGRTTAG